MDIERRGEILERLDTFDTAATEDELQSCAVSKNREDDRDRAGVEVGMALGWYCGGIFGRSAESR
jgi:hypothetical protein